MMLIGNLDFLVYGPSQQGVYCKYCALFGPENVRNHEDPKHVTELCVDTKMLEGNSKACRSG